jgi:transcription-repair coupling factor (superfamily II helicase)
VRCGGAAGHLPSRRARVRGRLRGLGCEAHTRSVTLHLREDTPLDPAKITELVRASRSPYRLTPDMRLTRRFDGELNGLANAETMLVELGKCLKV